MNRLLPYSFVPLCLCVSLKAAEPPSAPILRIDAGMHTAMIRKIATDATGTRVLTCSADKTAKLWALHAASGQPATLLRTFRIPIGEGNEGKLYACALSPDGSLAALGGFTQAGATGETSIYLFDTATGQMTRRLGGLPPVTYDLAFSAEGRFLAAALGGSHGVRVFEVASGRQMGKHEGYGDSSYGLDWQGEQRLVTTSDDGKVRLYRHDATAPVTSLSLLHETTLPQGKQPFIVRFSPDGQRLAVGFSDSTQVAVLSASDLRPLYRPATATVTNGDLSSVAWNHDGTVLAAGGSWDDVNAKNPVRQWPKAGEGKALDTPAADNTLMDLRALPSRSGGGFLFAAADPAWGVVTERGEAVTHGQPPTADFRDQRETLRLSPDGLTLSFGYEPFGKAPAQFSLTDLALKLLPEGESPPATLRPAKTTGLAIENWRNQKNPSLNGKAIELRDYETSRSLAIARDNRFFLLGCSFTLRCIDAQGQEQWQIDAPGTAWAVNLTANDQLAVAAFSDGTIRWYRADTGQELLAFFPHADRKRWVAWAPQGYFTCSPGAEELIGWHVNRGPDQAADFFPCSQLYDAFYRPDIVTKVITEQRGAGEIAAELGLSLNIEAALKQAPELKLSGATDGQVIGTDILQLTLEATDTGGGLKDIGLFHNGKRVPADGPPSSGSRGNFLTKTLRFTLSLAPGDNQIRAQAANDKDTIGTPAELTVKFNGVQATSTLHVFTIGLNRYLNPRYNLTYCVPDADASAAAFTQRAGGLFAEVKTHALRDDQATKANIAATFAELAKTAQPQDLFVFCYAGHGVMGETVDGEPGDNEFYLIPHDVTRMYGDPAMLAEKGVSKADLEAWCAAIPARKQLMLLDTCQSGGLVDTFAMRGVAEEKAIAQLARATGTVVIASTGAEAYARESKDIGHGIFTKALLDGIADGKADADQDGKITVKEIDTYIGAAVPELSQKLTNTPQFPTSYARGQDFPIGIVK